MPVHPPPVQLWSRGCPTASPAQPLELVTPILPFSSLWPETNTALSIDFDLSLFIHWTGLRLHPLVTNPAAMEQPGTPSSSRPIRCTP